MHRKYNCHLELPFFKQKVHSMNLWFCPWKKPFTKSLSLSH